MSNNKYIKLNADKSDFASALFNVKPNPVKRHPDEKLPEYNWYPVIEVKPHLPDQELYRNERSSWRITEDGLKIEITYEPTLVPLEQRQRVISERITKHRNQLLSGGIVFQGKPIDTRPETKQRVTALYLKAMSDPGFTSPFITEENEQIQLDSAGLIALGEAFFQYEGELVFYARAIKDQVEVSETPETVDISAGWPSNEFGA